MYQKDDKKVSEYRSKLSSIERDANSLKTKYLFQNIFSNVRDIETKIGTLGNSLQTVLSGFTEKSLTITFSGL